MQIGHVVTVTLTKVTVTVAEVTAEVALAMQPGHVAVIAEQAGDLRVQFALQTLYTRRGCPSHCVQLLS